MKEKLLLALKTKFANLGFKDATLDGVAAFLAITVTEETNIETAISGVEPLLKSFQGDADTRVQTAVEKAKADKPGEPKPKKAEEPKPGEEKPKEETKTETVDLAKLISEAVALATAPLVQKLDGMEKAKSTETRVSQLQKALEKAPELFKKSTIEDFENMQFADDSKFSEYLTKVGTRAAEAEQFAKNTGLTAGGRPLVPSGPTTGEKEATKEELDAVMPSLNL